MGHQEQTKMDVLSPTIMIVIACTAISLAFGILNLRNKDALQDNYQRNIAIVALSGAALLILTLLFLTGNLAFFVSSAWSFIQGIADRVASPTLQS